MTARRQEGAAPVVLHLISSLNVGGAERLLVSTMRAAHQAGDASYVIAIMNAGVDDGLYAELGATGFPLYRLERREGHLHPRYLRALLSIIDRHSVSIIHTHNEGSRFWGMLLRLMRPRLKLVYTVHSEGGPIALRGWKRAAYRRLVDATVAISRFIAEETRPLAVRNLTLIENGIPLDQFSATPHRPAETAALRLISVGRFAHVKGQDILLEAVARCRAHGADVTLTLAGVAAEPAFLTILQQMAARPDLATHVRFIVDRTDIETLLAGADVFILPSRQEGFGLALIEAMAAGLPVIAARTGGAADLVSDGINGLTFTPGDADALATCILTLSEDAVQRARLAEAGQLIAQRYDIRATLDAHQRLYRGLLAGGA